MGAGAARGGVSATARGVLWPEWSGVFQRGMFVLTYVRLGHESVRMLPPGGSRQVREFRANNR